MTSAIARIPTANGSRYLQQLCKHWSHNLAVDYDAERGTVVFPRDLRGADHAGDGRAAFTASADSLEVRVDAFSREHLDGLKEVVARHLDRFAFREAPLPFDWQPA